MFKTSWRLRASLLIAVLTLVVFSPALFNGFTNFDDGALLTENPDVGSLSFSSIAHIFNSTYLQTYIPLTISTFTLEHHFWGLNPFVYHLNNVLLHVAVSILLILFLRQLGLNKRASLFAAVIFALHPMRVESVVWISERKDVLYAFFYMGALVFYCKYIKDEKASFYLLSVFLGLLSMLAKPMALSLPLILFVCDWWFHRKNMVKLFLEKLPFLLYVIPITYKTYMFYQRLPGESPMEAVLLWIWCAVFYVWKFVFPLELVPIYQIPDPIAVSNHTYLFSVAFFVILLLTFFKIKFRWWRFALLFYFLSVFFLFRFDTKADTHIVADRFMYLASIGFCACIGLLIDTTVETLKKQPWYLKWIGFYCLIFMIFSMASKTFRQTLVWKDSLTLWNYTIDHNDTHEIAYTNRGVAHLEYQQYALAFKDFDRAVNINPQYEWAVYNRGLVFKEMKQYKKALDDFDRVISMNPNVAEYFNNRGAIYKLTGRVPQALMDFAKAIALKPSLEEAYINRGALFVELKEYQKAVDDFSKAIKISPDQPQYYRYRGSVYYLQNRKALADKDFNTMLTYQDPIW